VNIDNEQRAARHGFLLGVRPTFGAVSALTRESAGAPRCETGAALQALEARTLLAAVAWTGAAGDNLWSNEENWSGTIMPGEQDDVVIDAGESNPVIRFTAEAGVQLVRSLVLSESMTMTGGTLDVTGTAWLRAALTVSGGTLSGGSWDSTAGALSFIGQTAISRLEGPLFITGHFDVVSTTVRVSGSLSLSGTATITNGGLDYIGSVLVYSGEFILAGGRLGLAGSGGVQSTMTIGAGATVRGWGSVGGALFSQRVVTTLVNQGTITADAPGRFLEVAPDGAYLATFTNTGTVRGTAGGLLLVSATRVTNYSGDNFGTLTGGTWRADASSAVTLANGRDIAVNNAVIILGGSGATFTNFMETFRTNNGTITVKNGVIWSRSFPINNNGVITLESVSNLNFSAGGTHTGTFNIGGNSVLVLTGSTIFAPSARILGTGYLQFSVGTLSLTDIFGPASGITLVVGRNATINLASSLRLGSINNSGTLNIEHHALSLTNTFTQTSTGTLVLDLFGAGSYGQIAASVGVVMGGAIRVTNSLGFDPSNDREYFYTALLLQAPSMSGSFASFAAPSLLAGSFMWTAAAHSFELWHNIADYNGDGGVDGNDLEGFLAAWATGALYGDINCDGGTDGNDIEVFFRLWEMGGR